MSCWDGKLGDVGGDDNVTRGELYEASAEISMSLR
jgi:hypothetical protein